jgi:hypothetical protein
VVESWTYGHLMLSRPREVLAYLNDHSSAA